MQRLTYPIYWPLAYYFTPGSTHTARAELRNPSSLSRSYNAELYLGRDSSEKAVKATASFGLAPGEKKYIDFSVTMPTTEDTYHVYLNICSESELIQAFIATDDIVVGSIAPSGRLSGHIRDANTGGAIPNAKIYIDGVFDTQSASNGFYQTSYMNYGHHIITISADDYQTADFEFDLRTPGPVIDFELLPLPPGGEWPIDVFVEDISLGPSSIVTLGDELEIILDIRVGTGPATQTYDYPFTAIVKIDGETLTQEHTTRVKAGYVTLDTIRFFYATTRVGTFTIVAKDKSTTFEVRQVQTGTWYSPFGCIRSPVCTKASLTDGRVVTYPLHDPTFFTYDTGGPGISEPLEWSPSGAVVTRWHQEAYDFWGDWEQHLRVAIPDEWTGCPPYWETKTELAHAMADRGAWFNTIIANVGSQNCVKQVIFYGSWYGGAHNVWIYCPYCREKINQYLGDQVAADHFALICDLLDHIEQSHPEHPLSEPAW